MAVVGLFTGDDKAAYREEVAHPEQWCRENNPTTTVIAKVQQRLYGLRRLKCSA